MVNDIRNTQTSPPPLFLRSHPFGQDYNNERYQRVKIIIPLTAKHNSTMNVMTDTSIMLSVSLSIISLLKNKITAPYFSYKERFNHLYYIKYNLWVLLYHFLAR